MSETLATDDDLAPDVDRMIDAAWRWAARAIRAGRSLDAKRWLSVHARLTDGRGAGAGACAPARAGSGLECAPPDVGRPDQDEDAAGAGQPDQSRQGCRVHPVHPMHPLFPADPVTTPTAGPDPP